MSQLIYAHVAYGLVLQNDNRGIPKEFLALADPDEARKGRVPDNWQQKMLQRFSLENSGLEIVSHYLRGQQQERNRYQIPLLIVHSKSGPVITSSGDSPGDLRSFLIEYHQERSQWDNLIKEFVGHCKDWDINLFETEPHLLSYLTWDDNPTP